MRNYKVFVIIGKSKAGKTTFLNLIRNDTTKKNYFCHDIDDLPETEIVDRALFLAVIAFCRRTKTKHIYATLPCPRFEEFVKSIMKLSGLNKTVGLFYLPKDYDELLEAVQ